MKSCTVDDAMLCCVNCKRANERGGKSYEINHAVWDHQSCSVYKQALEKLKSDFFGAQ